MVNRIQTTFLERLRLSQLLHAEQIAAAVAAVGDDGQALAEHLIQKGQLTPFQLRQLKAGATSFHVGKYVVLDCLGRGGNGVVFKARHTLLARRYVALKTLDTRNLHRSDDALARFRREIDIVTRLEHPNVVRAYDVIETRSHLYLVLEFIAGRDLGSVVRERGPLPVSEAVDYTVQAARGLAYAHKLGIIHRDLKPANLLLTREGVVKLTDLGLARFGSNDGEADLTMQGVSLGTPEFMAPEQAENAAGVDARCDLYSLGATLFHFLTGELSVTGSSYMHRLQCLLTRPPRPLAEARPDAPAQLAAVVDRLRARDKADRPASADEAITLLEPFARKQPADDPSRWEGRRKAALVLEVLVGKLSAADACARHHVPANEFERWRQRFLRGAEQALEPNAPEGESVQDKVRELHAKIGTQAMEIETLKQRLAGG
jgi:serine/threonine protein kinase